MLFIVCYILSLFVQVVVIGLLSWVLKQIDSISIPFLPLDSFVHVLFGFIWYACLFICCIVVCVTIIDLLPNPQLTWPKELYDTTTCSKDQVILLLGGNTQQFTWTYATNQIALFWFDLIWFVILIVFVFFCILICIELVWLCGTRLVFVKSQ